MTTKQIITKLLLAVAFLGTLFWTIGGRYFLTGIGLYVTTVEAVIVSSIVSFLLLRSEPVQTWIRTPVVLLSLAIFNLIAAVIVSAAVPGKSGFTGGIALAVVGIGALVRFVILQRIPGTIANPRQTAESPTAADRASV